MRTRYCAHNPRVHLQLALLVTAWAAAAWGAEPATDAVDTTPTLPHPAKWAQPVAAKHLTNFYRVTDNLYRSAQPNADALAEAQALGIRTVINLRAFHDDPQTSATQSLATEHIESSAWHIEDEDVARFLRIVSNEQDGPFLVHCQHGADRTGALCALYRVAAQGWSKEDAIDEMTHGGYGFHSVWRNIVSYVRKADIEKIRRLAQQKETPEAKGASGDPSTKKSK